MSKGLASVTLIGSLGKDPEIRSTQSGKRVASFSVAVEEGFGDKTSTSWHDVVVWDPLVDFVEKYLKKGKSVAVLGKLQKRSWDDKQSGQKRYATEIVAKDVQFFDTGSSSGSGGQTRSTGTTTRRETATTERRTESNDDPFADDDIPF